MPAENTPATRTAAEIQAELESIDLAAREIALADDEPGKATTATKPVEKPHDYEYEARRKGWKPEAEYTGPEGKWVDAKTFVERGERFTRKLESEIETLKSKIASFEGTKTQFRKFFDDQMAKRDREHADAIAALRIQRSAAIREGDDALAVELEDRIDATKAQQAALKVEATQQAEVKEVVQESPVAPILKEWIEDGNDWFAKDEVLQKHAVAVAASLRKAGDKRENRAFLELVKAQVMEDFPRRFKDQPTARGSASEGAVNGGGAASRQGFNGKTERDLPAEDLALMKQFVKDGLYTKEQFLKSYFSRNG